LQSLGSFTFEPPADGDGTSLVTLPRFKVAYRYERRIRPDAGIKRSRYNACAYQQECE